MAEPITWRNVVGPSLADAARPYESAQRTLEGAFDRLGNLFTQQQQVNQGFQDRADEAKVLNFKEALAGATTMDDVARIRAQRNQMLSGIIGNKFRAETIGAEEARTQALEQRITAANKFSNEQKLFANQDLIQTALARAYQDRDPAEALKMLPAGLPNGGELVKQIVAASQGNLKFDSEQSLSKAHRELFTAQALAEPVKAQASADQARAALGQVQVGREHNEIARRGQDISLLSTFERTGEPGAGGGHAAGGAGGGSGSADSGTTSLLAGLKTHYENDKGKAEVMGRLVTQALQDPDPKIASLLRQLPPDVVQRIAISHGDTLGTGKYNPLDLGAVGRIRRDLIDALDQPSVQRQMKDLGDKAIRNKERQDRDEEARKFLFNKLFGNTAGAGGSTPAPGATDAGPNPTDVPVDNATNARLVEAARVRYAGLDPTKPIPKALLGPQDHYNPKADMGPVVDPGQAAPVKPAAAVDIPMLPGQPELRLQNPADSPAGRWEARRFQGVIEQRAREQQRAVEANAEATRQGYRDKITQDEIRSQTAYARELATQLLKKGALEDLLAFQDSAGFDLLDRALKARVNSAVRK